MKILIIGGTGNISTAITRILVARGDDVTLYNRGQTQVDIPGDYKTVVGDRYAHAAFEAQMAEAGSFDCVIDMIGYAPQDVASAVRAFGGRVGQYIFCSTVDVFTKPARRYPVIEGDECQPSPTFPYAYNKALCENILWDAHQRGDLALTIIRPAQTYNDGHCPIALIGPGPHFLSRVRQGKPILILGDGTSFWVAAHRDDVGPAFVNAIDNPKALGKAYNVTGDEWMTWEQYYRTVAKVMDAPPLNLVQNASFEDYNPNTRRNMSRWDWWGGWAWPTTAEYENYWEDRPEYVKAGKYSARFKCTGKPARTGINQGVPTIEGATGYELTIWAKGEGNNMLHVAFESGARGSFMEKIGPEWRKITVTGKPDAGAKKFNLYIYARGGGTLWIDDARLLPLGVKIED